MEFLDDRLRVWQDGGPHRHRSRPSGAYIDVRRDALAALLTGVQHDLVSFLRVLREWAQRAGLGPRADALGEAIDRNFAISNFAISNFAISNFAISNFAVPTCEVSDLADFNIGISGSTG